MMPTDLRRLHKYMLDIEHIDHISDEMRAVVERDWPELVHKLPPKEQHSSKGGKHAKTVFGHLRHIYISIRQLPGKPRQCDHAGCTIGPAHRDRRHRCYLSGPLPSRAGAPSILALRWMCPRICQSLV